MSKAFIQTLPSPVGVRRVARNTLFPSYTTTMRDYKEDAIFIHHAMRESMVFGLSYALVAPYEVESASSLTDRMLSGKLGRGFWSWEDVGVTDQAEPPSNHLMALAARRSANLPTDLRSISPRLAIEMLLASPTAVGRLIGIPAEKALGLTGYGEVQDVRIPLTVRFPAIAKRIGYSQVQSYLLENSGVQPFAAWIAQHTCYVCTLGATLVGLRETVLGEVAQVYKAAGAEIDLEWVQGLYANTVDELMRNQWDVKLTEGPDEEAAPALIKRLLIIRLGASVQFTGASLQRLGQLTGIAPAAFVRYAITDYDRRGETYISQDEVMTLSDMVGGLAGDELSVLAKQLPYVESGRDRQTEHQLLLEILRKATTWKDAAPEWGVGRPIHIKRLAALNQGQNLIRSQACYAPN